MSLGTLKLDQILSSKNLEPEGPAIVIAERLKRRKVVIIEKRIASPRSRTLKIKKKIIKKGRGQN